MKRVLFTLGLLVTFLVTVSFADSKLVEAAKKEKERRAKVKASKTITNKDIEEFKAKRIAEGKDEEQAASGEEEASTEETSSTQEGTSTEPPADYEPPKTKADDEGYWRQRFSDAQQRVQDAEANIEKLQSEFNALNRAFYAESDGISQRGKIAQEATERKDAIELAKQELAEAKQAMEDLQEEARREGALPGWVRE